MYIENCSVVMDSDLTFIRTHQRQLRYWDNVNSNQQCNRATRPFPVNVVVCNPTKGMNTFSNMKRKSYDRDINYHISVMPKLSLKEQTIVHDWSFCWCFGPLVTTHARTRT